jgi:hypothetical protein
MSNECAQDAAAKGGFCLGHGLGIDTVGGVEDNTWRSTFVVPGLLLKHPVDQSDVTTKLRRRLTIARRACYAAAKVDVLVKPRSESVDKGHRADVQCSFA